MRRVLPLALACGLLSPAEASAQITRHPTGVNVNATGATSVFLTFGQLQGMVPVQAEWCGALVSAAPQVGERCDPGTLYGRMPLRYDQVRPGGADALTDIMTIPPSVVRRAYQHALAGGDATFYYVRRFVDPSGVRPDEYVTVTCRMTEGGARTPFALTDVRLAFAGDDPVTALLPGSAPPPVTVSLRYNGTGRLLGRWEVVLPGEDPPTTRDLLPEAALPLQQRTTQRRYMEVGRFDLFLPPVGEAVLAGPDPGLLPTDAAGAYLLLMRIEASDDKEGDSSLSAVGAGTGIVHSGGLAGFALPPLHYHVGGGVNVGVASHATRLLSPVENAVLDPRERLLFAWTRSPGAVFYLVEVETDAGDPVLQAIVTGDASHYRAPPWLPGRLGDGGFVWRVVAQNAGGGRIASTPWQRARFTPPDDH